MSFGPVNTPRGVQSEQLPREQEAELSRKAERHAKLHGGDGENTPRPGFVARVLKRIRGRRD